MQDLNAKILLVKRTILILNFFFYAQIIAIVTLLVWFDLVATKYFLIYYLLIPDSKAMKSMIECFVIDFVWKNYNFFNQEFPALKKLKYDKIHRCKYGVLTNKVQT